MVITSTTGYLKYDDTDLDEDSWRVVKEELKETEENKKKCLDILKKKLIGHGDLNANLNDDYLLIFLRVSKYDCSKAYQRLIRFYEDKRDMPDVFGEYSSSSVEVVKASRRIYLSPYRMKKDKSAVVIWKRGYYDPSKHPYELIFRYAYMACDLVCLEEINQLCGLTIIFDMKSPSGTSWSEITPARLKLTAHIQKSMPLRIRGVHIVNASPIYYFFYSIIYPFLSAKIRNRIRIHKNFESLHTCIDPEILPKEYGGHLDQTDLIDTFERLREKDEYFQAVSKYGFTK